VKLHPGKNVIEFKGRRLDLSGRYYYEARLEPIRPQDDGIPRNNVGFGFTVIQGEPRILFCASEPELDRPLLAALADEKISVKEVTPEFLPANVESYLEYEAIVLSNVAAHQLSEDQMKIFESMVKTIGMGFIMIGGESSFGAGGYQGTPVERLLPVDMEIKQRKEMPNGALAMVVHSCELDNGNWWARQVIQQAIRILSPRDYAGVLYSGMSGDQWLFPMLRITERQRMLSLLGNFNPGDMLSFQPIMQMALVGLKSTPASIRHMVVLSDGDPTMPSQQLIDAIRASRITISTVCYGAHGPTAPPEFRKLAEDNGGKFYFLRSPKNLPEIFIRETATVQRSLISEKRFLPVLVSQGSILQGISADELPPLDGYVLTSPKALAGLFVVHPPGKEEPTQDPVLAGWSYGLGKSVAFTSDAGRRWGKDWTAWKGYQRFWGQCVRWVARAHGRDNFRFTRTVDGDRGGVVLDALTPDGELMNGLRFQGHVISPDFETQTVQVRQTAPGRYETGFQVNRHGTYSTVFSYEKDGRASTCVTGVSMSYSPEYRRLDANTTLLRQIAEAGGGRYFEDSDAALESGAFFTRDFPVSWEIQDIWRELLTAAVVVFFLDVFVRRVVVDYRTVAARAFRMALRPFGRRREIVVAADPRLSSLLERKARVREASATRYAAQAERPVARQPISPQRGTPGAAPAASDIDGVRTEERPPSVKRPEATAPPEKESAPAPETSFTERLLEAKRRALKRGEDRR